MEERTQAKVNCKNDTKSVQNEGPAIHALLMQIPEMFSKIITVAIFED